MLHSEPFSHIRKASCCILSCMLHSQVRKMRTSLLVTEALHQQHSPRNLNFFYYILLIYKNRRFRKVCGLTAPHQAPSASLGRYVCLNRRRVFNLHDSGGTTDIPGRLQNQTNQVPGWNVALWRRSVRFTTTERGSPRTLNVPVGILTKTVEGSRTSVISGYPCLSAGTLRAATYSLLQRHVEDLFWPFSNLL